MNLKILASADLDEFSRQKGMIPCSYLEDSHSSFLYKCKDSSGNIFIVKAFPFVDSSNPNNFCWLDKSVSIKSSTSFSDELTEITSLSECPAPAEILLRITVNEKIFQRKKNFLYSDFLRHALEPFYLANNCQVISEDLKSFGISEVFITSNTEEETCFQINETTKLILENVSLEKHQSFINSPLGGVDISYSELKKLPINMNLQNKCQTALIVGPTGCGKSSICHNFLLEEKVNVFAFQAPELFRQYPGETEEVLRSIFNNARNFVKEFNPKESTCIFLENIDVICPAEETANSPRITAQFVSLLDELYSSREKILVIATTNNAEALHHSLKRNGRFNTEIVIRVLDEDGRKDVLKIACEKSLENVPEQIIESVAKKTPGYVGADLILLVENVFKETLKYGDLDIGKVFEDVLKIFKPSSIHSSEVSIFRTTETFSTIGGMSDLKQTLQTSVLKGLEHYETFQKFNLNIPKGILLYGPPGCAKTTFAKCLATEANMTFIATSGAEVYSPYVGCAEKFISKIFDAARKNSPCLIFLDEIDTLIGKRSTGSTNDVQTRILSTLLTEMDGIGLKMRSANLLSSENKILVVAATNRPDMIDDALMRPGRFDRLIHVPPPDFESRLGILEIYSKKMPFSEDVDLKVLANLTENFSGSDICNLCNEVAMFAFMRNLEVTPIGKEDFEEVLAKTKSSLSSKQIQWYYDFEKKCL